MLDHDESCDADAGEGRPSLLPGLEGGAASAAALFRRLLETSPDAVVVVNVTGRILFANRQAERLFEYSVHELIGQSVDVLVPGRLRGAHAITASATPPHRSRARWARA